MSKGCPCSDRGIMRSIGSVVLGHPKRPRRDYYVCENCHFSWGSR